MKLEGRLWNFLMVVHDNSWEDFGKAEES